MQKKIACAAAWLLMVGATAVQGLEVRPMIGIGLTTGGDSLVAVPLAFDDSSFSSMRAGGLLHLYAGAEARITPQVSVQINVGHHMDEVESGNARLAFRRTPVELLGHYAVSDQFRVGGGVRHVSGVKLSGDGVRSGDSAAFDATTGAVLEGEYFVTNGLSLKVRWVSERYKVTGSSTGASKDGSHVGAYVAYYFN